MASASSAGDEDDCDYGWKRNLPAGVRFRPSDEELLASYLKVKVLNKDRIPPGLIKEINLYQYEPSQLKNFAFDHEDGNLYFLTPLHKKIQNGKRLVRSTPHGFWRATQKGQKVKSKNGEIVGTKTPLAYCENKGNGKAVKSQWLMNEFRMPQQGGSSQQTQDQLMWGEWALCVVHYHVTKNKEEEANSSNSDGQSIMADSVVDPPRQQYHYHHPQQANENYVPCFSPSPCSKRRHTTGVVIPDPKPSTGSNSNPYTAIIPTMHTSNFGPSTVSLNSNLGCYPFLAQNLRQFLQPNLRSYDQSYISNIDQCLSQQFLQPNLQSYSQSSHISNIDSCLSQTPFSIHNQHIVSQTTTNQETCSSYSNVNLDNNPSLDHCSSNSNADLDNNLGLDYCSSNSSHANLDNNLGLDQTLDSSLDWLYSISFDTISQMSDQINQIPVASLDMITAPAEHLPNQCTLDGNT